MLEHSDEGHSLRVDRLEDRLKVLSALRFVVLIKHVLAFLIKDSILLGIVLDLLLKAFNLLL